MIEFKRGVDAVLSKPVRTKFPYIEGEKVYVLPDLDSPQDWDIVRMVQMNEGLNVSYKGEENVLSYFVWNCGLSLIPKELHGTFVMCWRQYYKGTEKEEGYKGDIRMGQLDKIGTVVRDEERIYIDPMDPDLVVFDGKGDVLISTEHYGVIFSFMSNKGEERVTVSSEVQLFFRSWMRDSSRVNYADPEIYATKMGQYMMKTYWNHLEEARKVLPLFLGEERVKELAAGAGVLSRLREGVDASDLVVVPQAEGRVRRASISEVLMEKDDDPIFLMYGYAFCTPRDREILSTKKVVVIDSEKEDVVGMIRIQPNVWVNRISMADVPYVVCDRWKDQERVHFSQNLLDGGPYEIWFDNVSLRYLRAVDPTRKYYSRVPHLRIPSIEGEGPVLVDTLRELTLVYQQMGGEDKRVYFSPIGAEVYSFPKRGLGLRVRIKPRVLYRTSLSDELAPIIRRFPHIEMGGWVFFYSQGEGETEFVSRTSDRYVKGKIVCREEELEVELKTTDTRTVIMEDGLERVVLDNSDPQYEKELNKVLKSVVGVSREQAPVRKKKQQQGRKGHKRKK